MGTGMAVCCVCRDVVEAGFVVSVLEAAGIRTEVATAGLGAWAPGLPGGGSIVRVDAADAARARQVLEEARAAAPETALEAAGSPVTTALAFHRVGPARFASRGGWALIAALGALNAWQFLQARLASHVAPPAASAPRDAR